jgi:hypothetical protein
MAAVSIMSGGNKQNGKLQNIDSYSLFLGGTNVTHDVLEAYDPLRTGFARIFMVRKPVWLDKYYADGNSKDFTIFKHILEYGNTAISGLSDIQVETQTLQGGYTNKGFDIPVSVTDGTNRLTITVYEFSGSPVRSVIHNWINGTIDMMGGLTHYNGIDLDKIQANQTAEFIYVLTDNTGLNVEYACLFANCFPLNVNLDVFNYTSGQHEIVSTPIEFTTTKYESVQINQVARALLAKYRVLGNSLNFHSGYTVAGEKDNLRVSPVNSTEDFSKSSKGYTTHYDEDTGTLVAGMGSGTSIVRTSNGLVTGFPRKEGTPKNQTLYPYGIDALVKG